MKILKAIILLILFQSTILAQSGWFQQNSGTNESINSCFFLNDNTGFVTCNGGLILRTTNGGSNWFPAYSNSIYDMLSVYFVTNTYGWVLGNYLSEESTDTNIVLRTTNGGFSWMKSIVDTCFLFFGNGIYFVNPLTGYLACGNLKKTTNGGINWFVNDSNNSSGVYFINNTTGWIGGFGIGIKKTTNAGLNWVLQYGPIPHQYNTDFCFLNEQTGFCIIGYFGTYGHLLSTSNSGLNWNGYSLPYSVSSITFLNENTGYMLAEEYPNYYLSKTTNGGLNWYTHNINTSRYLSRLFFSSVNTGWVVGDSGLILKTTNGGVPIGIQPISLEIPENFSLLQNYPNPFNPSTKISFSIPLLSTTPHTRIGVSEGRGVLTKLLVYDVLGREAAFPVNEVLKPGVYEINFDASQLPSGVYYYRLISGSFSQTKKMVLLK